MRLGIKPPFEDGEDTEKALATEVIRWRRALRSHSEVLAVRLKGVIEGEGEVGDSCNLHFDMLQVP